jgi:hypothetical protein
VLTVLALRNSFVAAGGVSLAFLASLLGLVSVYTTLMRAFLACRFSFDTTAFSESGAEARDQGEGTRASNYRLNKLHR